MLSVKSEQKKIKPIVFLDEFLLEKIQRNTTYGYQDASHVSLLKYFPKYYKNLSLERESLTAAIQTKVKQLKIVRSCYDNSNSQDDIKTFKKLFRTNRKTFQDLPMSGDYEVIQNFSLCSYFPRIKIINLEILDWRLRKLNEHDKGYPDKSEERKIPRLLGYFWSGCGFVETLKVGAYSDLDLLLIRKIDRSKRFLSLLKNLELSVDATEENIQQSKNFLMKLMKNENFLRYVTHFKIGEFYEKSLDWEIFQSLIDKCLNLRLLSLPKGLRDHRSGPYRFFAKKAFVLNLSCLQNLQVLEVEVTTFSTFINGISFSPFLREITLKISDEESDNLKEFFDYQENQDEKVEYKTLEEGQSVQDYKVLDDDQDTEKRLMLNEFYEKWKELKNLKTLNLILNSSLDADTLIRNFVLPLLKAIPNLETFNYSFESQHFQIPQGYKRSFDLEAFLVGVEPMKSLQHLRIGMNQEHNCVFSGSGPAEKLSTLSNLSSVEIDVKIHSRFDLTQFLNGFLGMNDSELSHKLVKKSLKLPKFYLFRAQDLIKLLDLMHSTSDFSSFKAHLDISLIVESINQIFSNFQSPIVVTEDMQLTVNIFIKNFEATALTQEQEQYFQMVFGKLQFTVKKADAEECEATKFDSSSRSHRELMKHKLAQTLN